MTQLLVSSCFILVVIRLLCLVSSFTSFVIVLIRFSCALLSALLSLISSCVYFKPHFGLIAYGVILCPHLPFHVLSLCFSLDLWA